jgi:ABC-2 type transport system permease protein
MSPEAMAMDRGAIVRARPRPATAVAAVVTLAWRAMLKIKHVPFQLFDVTVMPIMFTLLFTAMFSGAMEAQVGGDYIQYLLPGVLVQTIVFITVYTGVGLNSDIHKGLFDRFRSMPMWQPAPLVGALAGDLFRYSVAGTLIVAMGYLLGFRPEAGFVSIVLAFGLLLVFALALSWVWIIIGMQVKTPESVMTTSFVFLMPLTFASDIFVPASSLKWEWLRVAVENNPVSHLAAAARNLTTGDPLGHHVWWVLGDTAAILLVAVPVAVWMYRKER